jgi:Immunity protein Imm1
MTTTTTLVFPGWPLPESVSLGTREDSAWPKACTDDERRALIQEIKTELDGRQRAECRIYSWDRPCRSMMVYAHDDVTGGEGWINLAEDEFPPQGMWAVAEFGHGALSFHDEHDEHSRLYVSANDEPFPMPPIIRYDTSGDDLFPRVAVLSIDRFHAAIEEYILTGQQPASVDWLEIKRSDLPQLDPRW